MIFSDRVLDFTFRIFKEQADADYDKAHADLEAYEKNHPKSKSDIMLWILQSREADALIKKTVMAMTPEQSKKYFDALERDEELAELERLKAKYDADSEIATLNGKEPHDV